MALPTDKNLLLLFSFINGFIELIWLSIKKKQIIVAIIHILFLFTFIMIISMKTVDLHKTPSAPIIFLVFIYIIFGITLTILITKKNTQKIQKILLIILFILHTLIFIHYLNKSMQLIEISSE
jgi:hypothetical protein